MSKHTPGPWHVEACPEHGGKHPLHDNRYVCASNGDYVCAMRDTSSQFYDARLIAAAPDMLAALERVVADAGGSTTIYQIRRALTLAHAAIAHAKGESHEHPCDECGEETLCEDYCGDDGQFLCPDCFHDGEEDPLVQVLCNCGWGSLGMRLSAIPDCCPVCGHDVLWNKEGE
jgi:hypothetical protein